jgi:CRISPR system Cascade subunit CasB
MSSLVAFLRAAEARQDRAVLAALRRGLGKRPGEAAEMFPYVVPYLPDHVATSRRDWVETCHYLVASLFALHPTDWQGQAAGRFDRNLGASVRLLKLASGSDGPERRFIALLNADREDLPEHLRSLMGLFKAHGVGVDWEQLLADLPSWDAADRSVQRRWARAFWTSHDGTPSADGAEGREGQDT